MAKVILVMVLVLSMAVPAFSAEQKKDDVRIGDPWAVFLGGVALIGIGAAVLVGGYSSHPAITSQANLGSVAVSMGDVLKGWGGGVGAVGLALIGAAAYKAFFAPPDTQTK